jgi:hypothetical protein
MTAPAHSIKASRLINHILRGARKRWRRLSPLNRPADPHNVLTCCEAHILAVWGAWPLTRRQRQAITGNCGRELRRLLQRAVPRELEKAIPSIVTAVLEAMRHE